MQFLDSGAGVKRTESIATAVGTARCAVPVAASGDGTGWQNARLGTQNPPALRAGTAQRTVPTHQDGKSLLGWALVCAIIGLGSNPVKAADTTPTADPVLSLMLEKGMVTEAEAARVQAQVDARRTNQTAVFPESKWKISEGIKSIELFGDVRLRYEDRMANDPTGNSIHLQRERYALRFGLKGEALDDFYYGFRLETSSNPRSSWVTMGTSSSGTYQGPFGKSTAGINIGQIYLGWKPEKWVDITVGKMPNPLYSTTMVWNPSINPEGVAERFKATVGEVDFFSNLGQFLYQDMNPTPAFDLFQIVWQGGFIYHITSNISAKVGASFYQYLGLQGSSLTQTTSSPYFSDPYIGEGAYAGQYSSYNIPGNSGYGSSGTLLGNLSSGYPNNQVGINNLQVLDIPFEINFNISRFDVRIFGDGAYNLDGSQRAIAAAAGYANYLLATPSSSISAFAPQKQECKAYQFGMAIGSKDAIGLVNGAAAKAKKNSWEVRTYWQHTEQYALDPNLIDTDFFEGVENLEGIYAAAAYSLTDNFIGTVRYGHANRINNLLGTGGSGQDIPQINPVNAFEMFQVDLTYKF